MRAVLDTNVLVSALRFPGGPPERIYRMAVDGELQLVVSEAILLELARVLTVKLRQPREIAAGAVKQTLAIATFVAPDIMVSDAPDPDDDHVLEAALAGNAELVVTGDRGLLVLRCWRGIDIVTPRELLARVDVDGPPRAAP